MPAATGAEARPPSALDAIFRPASIALIGVSSSDANSVGRQILDNLLGIGFAGAIYPVHPRAAQIAGLRCYPSVSAIGAAVDCAVVVVPRRAVLTVVDECVAAGLRALVVITGGFRELDDEGKGLEAELRQKVRRAALPLLGPNCMGLFNAAADARMNLTFAPAQPRCGHIAFFSQSGALGAAILTLATPLGLTFSLFASLGNEAGVTHLDALEYAARDAGTRVIALYLETLDRPAEFLRVAREVTRTKPVVCLKGGRTETGARAAASHTGALATASRAVEAVMRQSGVVLVDTTAEMLDVAQALARAPLPTGRRVRLLTNAGGPGVLASDGLARRHLLLPPLSPAQQARLRPLVTPQAPLGNPVDLTVEGTPEMYAAAARLLLDDPESDALLAIFVTPPRVSAPAVLQQLQAVARDSDKPVVAAFPAQPGLMAQAAEERLALVEHAEAAPAVLDALATYAAWRVRPAAQVRRYAPISGRVRKIICAGEPMDLAESLEVLGECGIPVAPWSFARDVAELEAAAGQIGFPAAMKVISTAISHKTEAGGVVLNINTHAELLSSYGRLPEKTVLLQPMVAARRELILGFRRDQQGTPLLVAGLGGILVEALDAVALRVLPVTECDVRDMLAEMPGAKVLGAFRGLPAADVGAIACALLRLAQLASDFDSIAEIDINPLAIADADGRPVALDARIVLNAAGAPAPA